jgi:hypothetical protein
VCQWHRVRHSPFPQLDPESEDDEFGLEIAMTTGTPDALALAEQRTAAVRGSWVNQGAAQDEYRDFVLAGRPASISEIGVGG